MVQSRDTLTKLGALSSSHWRCSVSKGEISKLEISQISQENTGARVSFFSVFSCIRTEYKKIRTRNNTVSEITLSE